MPERLSAPACSGARDRILLADRRSLAALSLVVGKHRFVDQRGDIGGGWSSGALAARKRPALTSVHAANALDTLSGGHSRRHFPKA